jgi:hypothetical protein
VRGLGEAAAARGGGGGGGVLGKERKEARCGDAMGGEQSSSCSLVIRAAGLELEGRKK